MAWRQVKEGGALIGGATTLCPAENMSTRPTGHHHDSFLFGAQVVANRKDRASRMATYFNFGK